MDSPGPLTADQEEETVPTTTRTKKDGSVYQRSVDGRWCASIEIPTSDRKRRRLVRVRATKALAEEELDKMKAELAEKNDLPSVDVPLRSRPMGEHRCPVCGNLCRQETPA